MTKANPVSIIDLRRAALAGDNAARAELANMRDEMARAMDVQEELARLGLPVPPNARLELLALAGDDVAQRRVDEIRRAGADLGQRAKEKHTAFLDGKARRKAAAIAAKAGRSQAAELSGAADAAVDLMVQTHNPKGPEFLSRSGGAKKARVLKIVCPSPKTCPPVLRRGAMPDDVFRWVNEAPKIATTETERVAALRCREMLGLIGSHYNTGEYRHPERFPVVALVHTLFLSALVTRRPGYGGVVAGVTEAELARRCASRGRFMRPVNHETVSRWVTLIRGTDGRCRAKRRCAKCLADDSYSCGELIEGAAVPGLFSDLMQVYQPPPDQPGLPTSQHHMSDGTVKSYGLNLYWIFLKPSGKKTTPGPHFKPSQVGLALAAINPSASDITQIRGLSSAGGSAVARASPREEDPAPPGGPPDARSEVK